MIKTYLAGIQLPVNPLDEVDFSVGTSNTRFETVALGDVTAIGPRGLVKVEIESLLTDHDYPFTVAGSMSAERYVKKIKSKMNAGRPVRFIITGDGLDINLRCSIESFKYSIHHGETDEYYYTLSLMEYRSYSAKRIVFPKPDKPQAGKQNNRPEAPPSGGSYTVKSGDSLWAIAKKHYGDGSRWPDIYNANKGVIGGNPNLIYPGQNLSIP